MVRHCFYAVFNVNRVKFDIIKSAGYNHKSIELHVLQAFIQHKHTGGMYFHCNKNEMHENVTIQKSTLSHMVETKW